MDDKQDSKKVDVTTPEEPETETPKTEEPQVDEQKSEEPEVETKTDVAKEETPVEPKEEAVVGGSRDGKNQGDAHPEIAAEKQAEPAAGAPNDSNVHRVVPGTDGKVVQHLDRDANDPRNLPPTPSLPSLNDPGQS